MSVANMEFHVTGSIVKTTDPMNIYMENIYADTYDTISGFSFITNCNYLRQILFPQYSSITSLFLSVTVRLKLILEIHSFSTLDQAM